MKKVRLTKTGKIILLCTALTIAGVLGYFLLPIHSSSKEPEPSPSPSASPSYSPSPTVSASPSPAIASKQKITSDLQEKITAYLTENNIDTENVGVYVHDFTSDAEYSLNADTYFIAASTYKLPLALYYYEKINAGEYSLDDTVTFVSYSSSDEEEEAGIHVWKTDATASPVPSAEPTAAPSATPEPTEEPSDSPTPEPVVYSETVGDLLHSMILYSDNTAAEGLYEHMGGWETFKIETSKYSDGTYSDDNTFTPAYMNDVLQYVYNHKDTLKTLLSDMLASQPDDYLNMNIGDIMAQKYGDFGGALNAVGLSSQGKPYSIAVYTYGCDNGTQIIGDLNEICYTYLNQ